jgi:hypothetical protein
MYQLTAPQQEQGRTAGKGHIQSWVKFPHVFFQRNSQHRMARCGHICLYVATYGQIWTEFLDVGILSKPR